MYVTLDSFKIVSVFIRALHHISALDFEGAQKDKKDSVHWSNFERFRNFFLCLKPYPCVLDGKEDLESISTNRNVIRASKITMFVITLLTLNCLRKLGWSTRLSFSKGSIHPFTYFCPRHIIELQCTHIPKRIVRCCELNAFSLLAFWICNTCSSHLLDASLIIAFSANVKLWSYP